MCDRSLAPPTPSSRRRRVSESPLALVATRGPLASLRIFVANSVCIRAGTFMIEPSASSVESAFHTLKPFNFTSGTWVKVASEGPSTGKLKPNPGVRIIPQILVVFTFCLRLATANTLDCGYSHGAPQSTYMKYTERSDEVCIPPYSTTPEYLEALHFEVPTVQVPKFNLLSSLDQCHPVYGHYITLVPGTICTYTGGLAYISAILELEAASILVSGVQPTKYINLARDDFLPE
ncbi:hypothetical protein C8R46DRAFT_1036620 [Mycena filopes]|nr:hypothetical protein C8R46DRAFT_1036620 [Mycena filopes]